MTLENMKPLRVLCHLCNGFVRRDPWSPAIDGVLAAALMRERLGDDEYAISAAQPSKLMQVEDLPLAKERFGDHWWYCASIPAVVGAAGKERKNFHRRFDDHRERWLEDGAKKVLTSAGPYKSARLWDTRVICRGVEWHVVGDAAEVERLLRRITQLGGRRGVGYGAIAGWEVTPDGADEQAARLRRPLPVAYAEANGVTGPVVPYGLTPPSWCAAWKTDCVMPTAV
jgi:CRISPR type IV-associated protein Csf3